MSDKPKSAFSHLNTSEGRARLVEWQRASQRAEHAALEAQDIADAARKARPERQR